jgi:hypothetical protein
LPYAGNVWRLRRFVNNLGTWITVLVLVATAAVGDLPSAEPGSRDSELEIKKGGLDGKLVLICGRRLKTEHIRPFLLSFRPRV